MVRLYLQDNEYVSYLRWVFECGSCVLVEDLTLLYVMLEGYLSQGWAQGMATRAHCFGSQVGFPT
eukprot:5655526-Amphidinium_carterae.2